MKMRLSSFVELHGDAKPVELLERRCGRAPRRDSELGRLIRRSQAVRPVADVAQLRSCLEMMTLAFANAADFLPVTASDDAYAILEGLTREQTAAIQEFNTETAIDNSKGPGLAQPVRKIRLKLHDKQEGAPSPQRDAQSRHRDAEGRPCRRRSARR